jgi:hypothetical protein
MRMATRWQLLPFVAVVSLTGCATIPTGPSVLVLPGPGKTLEQFQADDTVCRQWAGEQAARTAAGEAYGAIIQWRYDMPYQQCMYAKGHLLPRAPALNAIPPPPPPGDVPPPLPQPPPLP